MVGENGKKQQVSQVLFADDTAVVTDSEVQLRRRLVMEFGRVSERWKLKANAAWSKGMRCSNNRMAGGMNVGINGECFEVPGVT